MAGPAIKLANASPSGLLNFGVGQNGQPGPLYVGPYFRVRAYNVGSTNLIVTGLAITGTDSLDFKYMPIAVLPITIAPGADANIGVITFVPTKPNNTAETALLTITSNALSGLQIFSLTGTSQDSYPLAYMKSINGSFTADSSFIIDFGQINAGDVLSFTIELDNQDPNPDPAITVTGTPNAAKGFTVTSANPQNINPTHQESWTIQLTAPAGSGQIDITNACSFAVTAGPTFNVEVFYTIAPYVPDFILTGDQEQTVLALSTLGVPCAKYFDPNGTLNDGVIALSRQYYVDQPHLNKILNRIWLLFERYQAFVLTCAVSVVNPKNQPAPASTSISNTATDGLLDIGCYDLQITGSCINVQWTMPSNTGQFSLVGFLMKLDEIGEVIENT